MLCQVQIVLARWVTAAEIAKLSRSFGALLESTNIAVNPSSPRVRELRSAMVVDSTAAGFERQAPHHAETLAQLARVLGGGHEQQRRSRGSTATTAGDAVPGRLERDSSPTVRHMARRSPGSCSQALRNWPTDESI